MVRLIHVVHWVVLIFVITAWAWPWPAMWWVHVAFVPLMILHWRTNRNRCFLSQLEEKFKSAERDQKPIDVEESQFIKSVFKKLLGFTPSDQALEIINYLVMTAAWSFSVYRLTTAARTS